MAKETKNKAEENKIPTKIDIEYQIGKYELDHDNYKFGEKYLLESAQKGNNLARIKLACFYSEINECKKSHFWLKVAENDKCADVYPFLAREYEKGQYVEQDPKMAEYYYIKTQKAGIEAGYTALANNYLWGENGFPKDELKAFNLYKKALNAKRKVGPAPASFYLGYCYEHGMGTTVDYLKAEKYYKEALSDDNGVAAFNLGQIYRYGKGVERNLETALKYYLMSFKHNYGYAMNALGTFYENEDDYVNPKIAIYFYRKGCGRHNPKALLNYARIELSGKYSEQDKREARHALDDFVKAFKDEDIMAYEDKNEYLEQYEDLKQYTDDKEFFEKYDKTLYHNNEEKEKGEEA